MSVCSVAQSCLTLWDLRDCSLLSSPVHAIFQERILEWVAISYLRESSRHRDWTHASCIAGGFPTTMPPGSQGFYPFLLKMCRKRPRPQFLTKFSPLFLFLTITFSLFISLKDNLATGICGMKCWTVKADIWMGNLTEYLTFLIFNYTSKPQAPFGECVLHTRCSFLLPGHSSDLRWAL